MGMGNPGGSPGFPYPGFPGPGAGDLAGRYRKSNVNISTEQQGTVYDLISEGEIEGLVGGTSGVYLNETPITNAGVVDSQGSRFGLASTTATSTTVNSSTANIFSNLPGGLSIVQIQGAEHQTTLAAAAAAGATSITVANAFTSSSPVSYIRGLVKNSLSFANITIAGAGPDGEDYVGTLLSINGTAGNLSPAISTAVSIGATVEVDFFAAINTVVDGDTIGVARAVPVSVTNAAIQVLPPVVSTTADANFTNTSVSFFKGTRNQSSAGRSNAAAVSFIHAPSTPELQQSTATLGGSSVSIANSSLAGTTQPSQAPRSFSASTITNGASSDIIKEIDSLSVEFELPSGLGYFVKDGDFQEAVVEVQIAVEFTRGAQTEEIIFVNQSPKLNGSNQFVRQRAGLANPYPSNFSDKNATSEGLIIGETQGSFLASYSIDLTPYQPFDNFTLKIARISPEIFDNYTTDKGLAKGENALLACNIKTIQAGIYEKLSYPNSAYAVTTFSAQDFDTPPARAYHIRGRKVKVPSNYITREEINPANPNSQAAKYTRNISTGADAGSYQSWDGSFRGDESLAVSHPNYAKVYTNNPAWIFYDILTNKTYGLGDFLNEEDIDIYSLYQIARYCDELVPDGKGGQEPRFACNVYISSQQESYKVLKDLASVFRGMMYWIDGEIVGVQDRPKEPVYTFTQGNVIDGLFSYEYTGQRARINQVNVTWNDPEQFYRQSVVTVDDFDNIAEQNRVVTKDIIAFGCTSEGQATRVGRWHLLTDTQETEIVKFQTSINAGFLRPGDWIKIQDAKADNIEFSGRVSLGSTSTSIELDRAVSLQSGQSYNLYLIFPEPGCYLQQEEAVINSVTYARGDLILADSGGNPITTATAASNLVDDSGNSVFTSFSKNSRLEKKSITNSPSSPAQDFSVITVSSAFSSAPGQDVVWAVSNVNEQRLDAPITYRILGISEDAPNLFSIVGAKVVTEKYDELEKKWAVYVDPYKPVASKDDAVPAPTNLKVEIVPTPGVDADSSGSSLRVIVSWNEPTETFTDSNGNSVTTKYRFIDSYEIQHSFYNSRTSPITPLSAGRNSITFDNISTSGEVLFRIRTRNTSGQRSPFVSVVRLSTPSQVPSPSFDRLAKIVLGGQLTSSVSLASSTGVLTINDSTYQYVNPVGKRYEVIGATTDQSTVDFSSLTSGNTAYWYFDFSDTTDPWKTMVSHVDSVVENASGTTTNFSYWTELGAANEGLTLITGTVSVSAGSDKVIGVGTSFTSDYAIGDLIKLSPNNTYTEVADAEYFEVASIESDTVLYTRLNAQKSFSADYAYKQSFKPEFINDAILASITNTGGVYSANYFILKSGTDGESGVSGTTVLGTNETQIFVADGDGVIDDYTIFANTYSVTLEGTDFTYDGTSPYAADTFRFSITPTNISFAVSASGVITVSAMTADTADLSVQIINNSDGSTIATRIITFAKVTNPDAIRGSASFIFEESTTAQISATNAAQWAIEWDDPATTAQEDAAEAAAAAVIAAAEDGFIRPNDQVTISDNSESTSATRIYNGSATSSASSVQASNWSTRVTEVFDGSLIVGGTLSADRISADTAYAGSLKVTNEIVLGVPGGTSAGAVRTSTKDNFADNDGGFFLGWDSGAVKFNFGNADNYVKWDGSASDPTLQVAGTVSANRVRVGTGANSATMSGAIPLSGEVVPRFYTGGEDSEQLFQVDSSGAVHARNLFIYDANGNLVFSSANGFAPLALTQVAGGTGGGVKVPTYSESLANDSDEVEITLEQTSTLTVRVKKDVSWYATGTSATSFAAATTVASNKIPDSFDLMIRYSTSSGFTSTQGTLVTTPTAGAGDYTRFSKTTDYLLDSTEWFFDPEPGTGGYVSSVSVRNNHLDVDSDGQIVLTGTITDLPAGTYYLKAFMRTTDGAYSTAQFKVTANDPRTLEIQDNTADGGFIVDGGGSQSVGSGDITSVTAGDNLSGGGTAGAVTLALADDVNVASSLQVAGNVVWHAGNDGSTSGLDADTVDGVESSRIVYGQNTTKTTTNGNWNSALPSGFYDLEGSAGIGTPAPSWHHLIHSRHTNESNNYAMQISGDFFNVSNVYYRIIDNGTPTSWYRFWHTGNDGTLAKLNSASAQIFTGPITVSSNNAGGTAIQIADDGNLADLQDGYLSLRFTQGVRITSGQNATDTRHVFAINGDYAADGNITCGSSFGSDQGLRINSGSGSYGRIRHYEEGSNNQTIHFFGSAWSGAGFVNQSQGAINIDGVNGVTFGLWNSPAGYVDDAGNAAFRGNVTAYAYSDERLKHNIEPLFTSALDQLVQLRGVRFDWDDDYIKSQHGDEDSRLCPKHDIGLIAQEVQKILPEITVEQDSGYLAIRYEKVVPLLVEAIKEQQQQIEELKKLIEEKLK